MGTLRTLLAISVFLVHSQPHDLLVGGQIAVQLFYMFSGFLISFILIENKSYLSVKNFYFNRFLRLYPIYFITALVTIIFYLFGSYYLGNQNNFLLFYEIDNLKIILTLIFSNLFIFFQDLIFFLGVEKNDLAFRTNYLDSEIILANGLIIPQSWTLALELSFYLIAPFVLKNIRLIFGLIIFSFILRLYLSNFGLSYDPWTYRFFPSEIGLFLFGSLSHQLLLSKCRNYSKKFPKLPFITTFFLILTIIIFSFVPTIYFLEKSILLFTLFFFLIPLTFIFQSNNKWDKKIGELSYPIYITHISIISLTAYIMKEYFELYSNITIISLLLTVVTSLILNKILTNPVEKFRDRYKH